MAASIPFLTAIIKRVNFILISSFILFFVTGSVYGQTTLFSYQSGAWNNLDTWTTDPSGTLLTGSKIPAAGDIVIILSSRQVTLTANVTALNLDVTINSGGILELDNFRFNSQLAALRGQGILRLRSSDFPSALTNTFVNAGGGTTEYYNFNGNITQPQYNHLKIQKKDNTATGYTIAFASNVTIYGDFTIERTQGTGALTVTVGNNNTSRNISITGNLSVSAGATLNTATNNVIHNLSLSGDFTNNGTVQLSNSAQYAVANNGAAIFTFTGATDNSLMCNGPTSFYRFILNKGIDRTYVLTVTSSNAAYFRLFGPVTTTGGDWSTLPLHLINGTLRLRSAVNIPILGKNTGAGAISEFHIPGTAGLWIDGATVATSDDGGVWRGITVYGLFRISSGTFTNPNNTGGITYFGNTSEPGYLFFEGGTVNTTQIKQADVNGRVTYHQTGGTVNIKGYSDSRGSSAVFALPTADFVFIMSGGHVYIAGVNTTGTNGIDIRVSSSNYNVTGGTFTVVRPSAVDDQPDFHIYSTAPFYNLTLKDTTTAGTDLTYQLQSDLVVLNDLMVQNRPLNTSNFNVTVGGHFSVGSGATYTPGLNTTTFNGTGNQTFTFNGTVTTGLNNLVIDKPSGVLTFTRTTPTTLDVRGNFDLTSGTFNDGGNTLEINGNVTNSGLHTGTGAIALVDNDPQTIGGNGNGFFQNLTLNNSDGSAAPVSTTADIGVNGVLSLTSNKIFNISSYGLYLGQGATITGTFSATRFIATNGDIGDKGITKAFSTNSFTFPIGVIPTAIRYTPTTISFTAATRGSVNVIPVDAEQMQTSPNGRNRSLTYFWRVRSSGFSGLSNVTQTFNYSTLDVVTGNPQIDENGYVPARYNPATFSWTTGTAAQVNEATNMINWPNNVNYIDGDYTAGDDDPQDPFGVVEVLYSAKSGSWYDNDVWMTDTTNPGSIVSNNPDANTPVMIRNGHTILIGGNTRGCGNLQIQETGVLNCQSFTGLNLGIVSNHMNGSGKIRISSAAATASFPAGDFTAFRGSSGGTVEYYTNGTSFTIPTTSSAPSSEPLTYYNNLLLNPLSGQTITMPNVNMMVYNNMTVQGQSSTGVVRLNTAGARTLTINGSLAVTTGNLQFRSGQSQTLRVDENITIGANGIFDVQNAGTTANTLTVYGSITNNGVINFNPNTSYCNLVFAGGTSASLTGTGNTTLRNVDIDKGSSQATLLTVNVSGATFSTPVNNWLTLTNGTFQFMRTGNLNITTTSTFNIPVSAGLYINHAGAVVNIANDSRDNNDLYLNGKLTLVEGTINVGPTGAPNYNNDIEYSASGNSEIDISGGILNVNGQVRRSLTGTGGVLSFRQTGGDVTIRGNNQADERAKLEIVNAGSEFTMTNGTLTLIRGGGTTYGDLYLRPSTGSVSGGTIYFGTQNVGAQTFSLDAIPALNNLTINGVGALNTLQLMVNSLQLNGNLVINNATSSLVTNNIDVSLKGNFTNNGTYTPGTNITEFNGNNQTLNGTTSTSFYDLIINPTGTVNLTNSITVNHNLTLSSGTFSTSTFNVNVKGNVSNNANHSGDSNNGGILLNGTALQLVSGTGTYGRLELNNASGARLLNDIVLQQDFLLTNGVFDINQFMLNLGINSDIVGSGFNSNKMIKPDGVLSNIGIRKYFNPGATTFTYPIGVTGKYTRAVLNINSNSTGGSVRVNVINAPHPTVTDINNVLQYYWEVESSGISGFEGEMEFNYINADVRGTESDYVAAALIIPPGTGWSKASTGPTTDNVDEDADSIKFNFPAGTTNIGGEYTAGTDGAIPDQVPLYTSNNDGNWDDVNIWTPQAPAGGPNGFIVVIRAGDSVSTNGNRRFAYRTTIDGTLYIGTTYGHNLGHVNGTGKMLLETATLPAGRLTNFLGCEGGTLEYSGSTDYTIVADRLDTIRNLYFTGTGTRILPDKDLTICNLLKIDGPILDNSVYNRKLTLLGNILRLNTGTFVSGTGANATVAFKGSSPQQVGTFTGGNAFNNLELDNAAGLTLTGPVDLKRNLLLTDGVITTTTVNILSMINWTSSVVPVGGSASSFVSGPLSKEIFNGDNFEFPSGKADRYGKIVLGTVGGGAWVSEYFNTGHSSSSVAAPLTAVSLTEYWHVKGPAGSRAYVKLRWDAQSDITPLTTQSGLSDIRVAEFNAGTWNGKATTAVGDDYDGTAVTNNQMNLDEHDYTLASISSLKPRASFTDTEDACVGDDLFVAFTNTAASYTFSYSISGGAGQIVTTTNNPYTLATAAAGRYKLLTFTGGVIDTNTVMVYPVPNASLACDEADLTICAGDTVVFTAGGGVRYEFRVNGTIRQTGVTTTFSTAALTDGDVVSVTAYNANNCPDMAPTLTIDVSPLPVPTLTGPATGCSGCEEIYTTENDAAITNYTWTVTGGTLTGANTYEITVTWNAVAIQYNDRHITVNYTDANGCTASTPTDRLIRVFHTPVTGPAYHIPNTFNQ